MTLQVGPPETPTTVADEAADAAVTAAVGDQLKETRSAADSWQKGLAGLLTILTSVLFIKGKDTIDKLDSDAQVAVAAVLLLAGALAVGSTFLLLRAAYGQPHETDLDEIREKGLYFWNYTRAERSASYLSRGQALLIAMLACVALAVMITWFGKGRPEKNPAYQILDPITKACGPLAAADNGQLKITSDNQSVTIVPGGALARLSLVRRCP